MNFLEIGEQPLDVVERVRTLGMPGQLHALPRGSGRGFRGLRFFAPLVSGPFRVPSIQIRQHFHRVGAADLLQRFPEFAIRTHLHGNIQDNGKIARKLQAKADFGFPRLILEQFLQRAAGSMPPFRPSRTRIEISDGSGTRATSSGTISCTEILGGAFSSGNTRPRTSTALSSSSIGARRSYLRGEQQRLHRPGEILELHRRPGLAFRLRFFWMVVSTPQSATSTPLARPSRLLAVVRGQVLDLVAILIERMAGDVEAEHFLFVRELVFGEPVGDIGQRLFGMLFGGEIGAEQADLCPLRRSFQALWPHSMAESTAANNWERVPSSESMAPALMRLSIMRRLTAPRSTFSQNW